VHFDPHLTINFKTNNTLSFVYSKLVRHKVAARFGQAPSSPSPIWPNAGKHRTRRPMSSICAKA
jgi:hypothetical protein